MKQCKNLQDLKFFYYSIEELQKIAKTLHRLDENACNYGLSKWQETREKNLTNEAKEIAKKMGLYLYRQGDPRGCPLYLMENNEDMAKFYYPNGLAIT